LIAVSRAAGIAIDQQSPKLRKANDTALARLSRASQWTSDMLANQWPRTALHLIAAK
jgi:hypothetical protein